MHHPQLNFVKVESITLTSPREMTGSHENLDTYLKAYVLTMLLDQQIKGQLFACGSIRIIRERMD